MNLKLIFSFATVMLLVLGIYYVLYIKDNIHRNAIKRLSTDESSEVIEATIKQLEKIDRASYGTIIIIAILVLASQSFKLSVEERIRRLEIKVGISKESQTLNASDSSSDREKDSNEKDV